MDVLSTDQRIKELQYFVQSNANLSLEDRPPSNIDNTYSTVSSVFQPLPAQTKLDNWHQSHHIIYRYMAPLALWGSKGNEQQR